MERNKQQEEQDKKTFSYNMEVAGKLGLSGNEQIQAANMMGEDKKLQRAAFKEAGYRDRVDKMADTNESLKQIYRVNKAYSDAKNGGASEQEASSAALKVGTGLVKALDGAITMFTERGDTAKAKEATKSKEKLQKAMTADSGLYDFQGMNVLSAEVSAIAADQKKEMDNTEAYTWLDSKGYGTKDTRTADQKNSDTYGTAKDTPEDRRTTSQQRTVDKAEKNTPTKTKDALKELDSRFSDDPIFSSKQELKNKKALKREVAKIMREDKSLSKLEPFEIVDIAEKNLGLGDPAKGNNTKPNKNKKQQPQEGTTGTHKGKPVVFTNGKWKYK